MFQVFFPSSCSTKSFMTYRKHCAKGMTFIPFFDLPVFTSDEVQKLRSFGTVLCTKNTQTAHCVQVYWPILLAYFILLLAAWLHGCWSSANDQLSRDFKRLPHRPPKTSCTGFDYEGQGEAYDQTQVEISALFWSPHFFATGWSPQKIQDDLWLRVRDVVFLCLSPFPLKAVLWY